MRNARAVLPGPYDLRIEDEPVHRPGSGVDPARADALDLARGEKASPKRVVRPVGISALPLPAPVQVPS